MESHSINTRYQTLDAWRGLACLMVVVFHSTRHAAVEKMQTDGSIFSILYRITEFLWIGVPIFFVISGYCITASIDSKSHSNFDLKRYLVRRFKRIYPPYWIMIFLLSMIGIAGYLLKIQFLMETPRFFPPWWRSRYQWLGNLTLTED